MPLLARLGCCLLALGLALPAPAQNAAVRGFVRDASDGQPLAGVNVILRGADGGLFGNATDRDGYYIVNRIPPGTYAFEASFIGYEPFEETLTLEPDGLVTRNIELAPSDVALGELTVESEAEGAASMEVAGLSTVRATDIQRIPTPGLSADLVGYLQAMPGVVAVGDRGGQLFVRGGTPTQNLVLIDGIPLYQPFHVIGFYSAFPADIVAASDVYAGGFGARFGGRISSVIDVQSRTGNNRSFAGALSAGPFLTTGRLEGPIWPGKVSFLTSVRESVIEPVAPTLLDRELPYRFWDRFARVHATLGARNSVSATAMQTYDRGNLSGLEEAGADGSALLTDDDRVTWENEAYGIRFLHVPAGYPLLGEVVFSYARLRNTYGPAAVPDRAAGIRSVNAGGNLTYLLGGQELEAGFEIRSLRLDYALGGLFQGLDDGEDFLTEASVYLDAVVPFGEKFLLRPGARATSFRGELAVEPRARVIVRPGGADGRQQISAAWGLYRQQVAGLNDRRDAGDVFTAWASAPLGETVPTAMHVIGGYQVHPARGIELAVEAYYKSLADLLIPEWTSFPRFTTRLQDASGEVRGADVRAEVGRGWFYGYLSYGYSVVEYAARQPSLQIWYGTDELVFHPAHDRRHQVNALAEVEALGFDLSMRWQFGSGLPFSQSTGFDTWVLLDGLVNVGEEPGAERVLYAEPYGGRLPVYHRFDASLERAVPLGQRTTATFQAGLVNAYDRRNLFYLDIFTLRRINQLPLIPSFGIEIAFE